MNGRISGLIIVLMLASCAFARDIQVDGQDGSDASADGPYRTISRAIRLAAPGDVIHVAPGIYRQSVEFINKSGEAGKPITVDGHGATLWGSDPLVPSQWKEIAPGLWRSDEHYKAIKANKDVVVRYFFLFDGKMQLMGRSSKGPSQPFKKPEDLRPGEWTFIEGDNAFVLRIAEGQSLADAKIEAPSRSSGLMVYGGNCEHLVLRNFTVKHVYNDGVNVHGRTRDVLFQNITAIQCGDAGFSAHDDCEVRVEGFTSIGNSTGICNVGQSKSYNERVLIQDCIGYGFYTLNGSSHVLKDSRIVANAFRPVVIDGGPKDNDIGTVEMENVRIESTGGTSRGIQIGPKGRLTARRITAAGLPWIVQGKVKLEGSAVSGTVQIFPGAAWEGDNNRFALESLRMGSTFYKPTTFGDFQTASGQEKNSRWVEKLDESEAGLGADTNNIPVVAQH